MKKRKTVGVCLALCMALGVLTVPANSLKVQAEGTIATVSGTVRKGTTADLLLLAAPEGNMEIKLDSGTDTSGCKLLLPDRKVSVSVSHGSDGYLHAVKITSSGQAAAVSVDSSKSAVVTGKIKEKSTGDILYLDTKYGEMELKLDATTDMSGCKVLVTDKTYSVTCARGSDAYMHAISISDAAYGSSSGSGYAVASNLTPSPDGTVSASTTWVSGTVTKNTESDLLCLSTGNGEMEIKLDSATDSRNGMMAMPGRMLSVAVYRGNDAYMHAANITGAKSSMIPVQINTSSPATVTGTVSSKSTENMLYMHTQYGDMELKLDALGSASGFKILVQGQKVSVSCARGDDAYMHALSITAIE